LNLEDKNVLGDQLKWQFRKTRMPFITWETNSSDNSGKHGCHSLRDCGRSKNISYKDSRDPGDILRKSRLYYSRDFWHVKALGQMGAQMSQCCSEAWLSVCFRRHFGPISMGSCGGIFFNHFIIMDETWIHIYKHDPETKEQSKKWRHSGSPCPKKFKTHVIKQCAGNCLLEQRWMLLVDYL
jgi:hypothetical protein